MPPPRKWVRQSPKPKLHGAQTPLLGVLALALLVAASYFPAVFGGFVWDDRVFTEAVPVREFSGLWRIWLSPSEIEFEGHYWPLTYTTFWLEHKLWGFAPAGFHIVNLALHTVNAALLWRLLERLAVPGAWVAAAVFAVHPVHVEAVAWIMGRKDLLATLFYLAAAAVWMSFIEAPHSRRRTRRYFLALGLFAAGLLCKSIGVTLPVALLVLRWWKRGRVTGLDMLRLAPFFVVGAGIAAADLSYYEEAVEMDHALFERPIVAAKVLWFYLGKLLWPTGLVAIYPRWEVDAADLLAWGWVAAALALPTALWLLRRRIGRGPLAGALFFALTLSPVLGFVEFGYMQFSFVADRYQYLASAGPLAVVIAAANSVGRRRLPRWSLAAFVAAALALLGALTWRQADVYRDDVAFFNYVIERNPTARHAHLNLSRGLFESGRWEDGLAAVRTHIAQTPNEPTGHYNAGLALLRLGRPDEALESLQRALLLDADMENAQFVAGLALAQLGRLEEAASRHHQALEIDPNHLAARVEVGNVLGRLGRLAEAERHLTLAVETSPNHLGALMALATTLFLQQRHQEALDIYSRVVELAPDNVRAHSGAGAALHYLGRDDEALKRIDQALALDPTLAEAHANRAAITKSIAAKKPPPSSPNP